MSLAHAFSAVLLATVATVTPTPIALPGTGKPIGFDDLTYSEELRAILVPAGATGRVDLVDARTRAVSSVEGLSASDTPGGGHADGTTSADAGRGYVFASDRTRRALVAIDPRARRIEARAALGGEPDYVRWVAPTQEVWVTEPDRRAIEILRLEPGPSVRLSPAGRVELPTAPESLVVDPARGRAYTNSFHAETYAIDLRSRAIAGRWRNRCRGARGIALDAARGLLFVGCAEGKAVSLDVAHGGTITGEVAAGAGVDSIAYSAPLAHLYVPAAVTADVTVVGVSRRGELAALGTYPTAHDAHCAAADDEGGLYVCDPGRGRLLLLHDAYEPSR